jgi:uncharacterized membrane protein
MYLSVAKFIWYSAPYVFLFIFFVGLNVAIVLGFWKIEQSELSTGAKFGVAVVMMLVYLAVPLMPPIQRYCKKRDSSSGLILLVSFIVGGCLFGGIAVGILKLFQREMQTGQKAVLCFALVCCAGVIFLGPRFLMKQGDHERKESDDNIEEGK